MFLDRSIEVRCFFSSSHADTLAPATVKICAKFEEKSAEAVTTEQVMAMANYLFDPDKVATSFPFRLCPTSMATASRVLTPTIVSERNRPPSCC
jgi:hypothetical protein